MEFHKIQVTTGTLSPPYGDCTEAWHDSYKAILLSLPHGDDTMDFYYWGIVNLFSPPYGDGIYWDMSNGNIYMFSPPCGECTLNISQNTAKLKSRMARKYSLYCNDVFLRCKEQP